MPNAEQSCKTFTHQLNPWAWTQGLEHYTTGFFEIHPRAEERMCVYMENGHMERGSGMCMLWEI